MKADVIQLASKSPTIRSETPGYPAYLSLTRAEPNAQQPCYGFGLLWIPDSRRGDFHAAVRQIKAAHRERLDQKQRLIFSWAISKR
jgi:hypothetical protein